MSETHLGLPFDIHGGGADLIFPHHENEIAQSECASGTTFARLWMHNGMIRVDQEKMSKSLGNFFTIRDLLERFDAQTIRHFLLSHHYRSPADFSPDALEESRRAVARAHATLARIPEDADAGDGELPAGFEAIRSGFETAMDDDFNTARALGSVFEGVRALNRHLDEAGRKPSPEGLARGGGRSVPPAGARGGPGSLRPARPGVAPGRPRPPGGRSGPRPGPTSSGGLPSGPRHGATRTGPGPTPFATSSPRSGSRSRTGPAARRPGPSRTPTRAEASSLPRRYAPGLPGGHARVHP